MTAAGTIADVMPLIRSGRVRSSDLVDASLAAIEARGRELNAFITVVREDAREEAAAADRDAAAGRWRGPLHGVPISVKDLIDVAGTPTTAASRVRAGHVARADAPVVARLRAAGAVVIGKTNLHEFAFGTTNEESAYGPARNPYDPARSPGGSSGGSAISVATGMALASVGTDTGGSIRIPAAACGIVGLKPRFGEIPCDGVVPLGRSLDHVGPLARSVRDACVLYDVMRGVPKEKDTWQSARGALEVAIPRRYFLDRLEDGIRSLFEAAVERLRAAGHRVRDADIPHADLVAPVYLHTVLPEAAAYHAPTLQSRPGDYGPAVRLRLEMGRYLLAEDYVRAQEGRETLRLEVDRALAEVHALVLPALPIPAPPIGAAAVPMGETREPVRAAMLRLTQLFNLTGHPAISVPMGVTATGLPGGFQIVAMGTPPLLQAALALEPVINATPAAGRAA
jgi:aspartyl-tRNA(Asn)/glutamyl-tRNA(Gln) amidotransferase subunit A